MRNIFWMPEKLCEEDRFTTSLHFLVENIPAIGQTIIDHLTESLNQPRTRLVAVIDHPTCKNGAKPDFLFECEDFDIICEHKVASRLRVNQLETYLKLKRDRPFYVALITRDECIVPSRVVDNPRYLRPRRQTVPHFRWHDIYHILVKHESRVARDFVEYMRVLGMAPLPPSSQRTTVEDICRRADDQGIGALFRAIRDGTERNGLYARPYKYSVMYTPPQQKNRMLFTVCAERTRGDHFPAYISPGAFAEFFPRVTQRHATRMLGEEGWYDMDEPLTMRFITGLDSLMNR